MNPNNVTNADINNPKTDKTDSVARKVAEGLHERVDRAAAKGENLERSIHEKSAQAQQKAGEMSQTIKNLAAEKPWMVVGGSIAIGFVLSALLNRR